MSDELVHRQPVRLKKGAVVLVDAGAGAQIEVTREKSGAVLVRNVVTGHVIRQWTPKEARRP